MIKKLINNSSYLQRKIILIFLDSLLFLITLFFSYFVINPINGISVFLSKFDLIFVCYIVLQITLLNVFNVYAFLWRYNTLRGIYKIFKAVFIAHTFLLCFSLIENNNLCKFWIINSFFVLNALIALRISLKLLRYRLIRSDLGNIEVKVRRVLIVGAGDAGEMLSRELSKSSNYNICGFIDDDHNKKGQIIHKYKVLGQTSQLKHFVEGLGIDLVIIAMPSANGRTIKGIVNYCSEVKVKCRVTPSLNEIFDGKVTVSQLRDVKINDLLRRNQIDTEIEKFSFYIRDKTVLITGAGGSIGSEMSRQVVKFGAKRCILLDHSEYLLFEIHRKLLLLDHDCELIPAVADIRNKERLEKIFSEYSPEVVFHAAAYKHVPLMEEHVQEAILNNILGVNNLIDLADQYKVNHFVIISTDKAVNPANVMGATKRVGEVLMQLKCKNSTTKFCAVRFGNVLGSHGSVVPLFREQIQKGGPLTVTHKDMTRYFMTIPEAVRLVLHAGSFSNDREIFILDMGDPIRILDLAKDMIRLSGLKEGEDIEIEYSGLRPGEKMEESLYYDIKYVSTTSHPKIMLSQKSSIDSVEFEKQVSELILHALQYNDSDELKNKLFDCVNQASPVR